MGETETFSKEPRVTYSSSPDGHQTPPDLRILHYNDVYHVDPASAEPVGGLARFVSVCKEYQEGEQYAGQPEILNLFSGDAFNPSLESSVTKGKHMVPALNAIGTHVACVGNHDFDFGVKQFEYLTGKCNFPWLIANVLDPALGDDVPLGHAKKTHMMTTSSGIKIGFLGLGEREWLITINSLPPNIIYKSASATAKELVPQLRAQGADIVICLSHQREINDKKLAEQTDGIIDIILGGHDHYYSHSFIKGTHVLRSGSDFKQLSYLEARKGKGEHRWDFDIWRRDITSDIAEHKPTVELVSQMTSKLHKSLAKVIGWSATPLDARFSTVRQAESNIGNFVCDIMKHHHHADCTIMAAGTIRGDQIYPPGVIRVKDITNCFPFEDPAVLLRAKGSAIWDALENGVSTYPASEGRFPQVAGLTFEFDPSGEPGKRLTELKINGETYDPDRKYLLATRGYMGRGKDGYSSLLVESEGGEVEELIDEENGILISAMLRQYFMGLRTIGQWKNLSEHWVHVADRVETPVTATAGSNGTGNSFFGRGSSPDAEETSQEWRRFLRKRFGLELPPAKEEEDSDVDSDDGEEVSSSSADEEGRVDMDGDLLLMRKFWARWVVKAGVKSKLCDPILAGEYTVDWTRVIAPVLEGRIRIKGKGV